MTTPAPAAPSRRPPAARAGRTPAGSRGRCYAPPGSASERRRRPRSTRAPPRSSGRSGRAAGTGAAATCCPWPPLEPPGRFPTPPAGRSPTPAAPGPPPRPVPRPGRPGAPPCRPPGPPRTDPRPSGWRTDRPSRLSFALLIPSDLLTVVCRLLPHPDALGRRCCRTRSARRTRSTRARGRNTCAPGSAAPAPRRNRTPRSARGRSRSHRHPPNVLELLLYLLPVADSPLPVLDCPDQVDQCVLVPLVVGQQAERLTQLPQMLARCLEALDNGLDNREVPWQRPLERCQRLVKRDRHFVSRHRPENLHLRTPVLRKRGCSQRRWRWRWRSSGGCGRSSRRACPPSDARRRDRPTRPRPGWPPGRHRLRSRGSTPGARSRSPRPARCRGWLRLPCHLLPPRLPLGRRDLFGGRHAMAPSVAVLYHPAVGGDRQIGTGQPLVVDYRRPLLVVGLRPRSQPDVAVDRLRALLDVGHRVDQLAHGDLRHLMVG